MLRAVVGCSARQRQTRRGLSGPGLAALVLSMAALPVRAGIFQWEWVDPGNRGLGIHRSSSLCPDGERAVPGPGADLSRLDLTQAYLPGANLAKANLDYTNLTNASLVGANLKGASLQYGTLAGADFTGADLRSAKISSTSLAQAKWGLADLRGCDMADFTGPFGSNIIGPDGTIRSLQLTDGQVLTIRDPEVPDEGGVPKVMSLADAPSPMASIQILVSAAMKPGSTLRLVLGNLGFSRISFATDIPVYLEGNLELALAPDVDSSAWVGKPIQLFDWWYDDQHRFPVTGTVQFNVISDDGLTWDTSALYTQGTVTLVAVPEPASVALLALGGLTLLRRRRDTLRAN